MKVLLITDHEYPAYGPVGTGMNPKAFPSGSAYHLHDLLARGLAEEGHEVYYRPGRGAAMPLPQGVTFIPPDLSPGDFPQFDICHTPIGPLHMADLSAAVARERRAALLLTCHTYRQEAVAQPNWVFVSGALARMHGADRVVINGLDPDDYVYSETKQDYLLFIGAMNHAEAKGLHRALALSVSQGFRLIVAGTALDTADIENVAKQCAAAGAEYVGDVRGKRKAELFAGARALLFPSRFNEGGPLVIAEAMLSGTPVISSAVGGCVEMVTPETGVLCESDDDWVTALDRIRAISPERCRQLGVERFHYRRMTRDYLREYEREL